MSLFTELLAQANKDLADISKTSLDKLCSIASEFHLDCRSELRYVKSLLADATMKRIAMPVIDPQDLQNVIMNQCNIGCETCELDPMDLIPIQKNLYLLKAIAVLDFDTQIIVSNDNYIIDGNHRWLASILTKRDNVKCIRLNDTIDVVLPKIIEISDSLGNERKD